MTENVAVLRPVEAARIDTAPVAVLYRDRGVQAAEELIGRALAEMAQILATLSAHMDWQEFGQMARPLRRLQRIAEQLGVIGLAHVAQAMQDCLDSGDGTALHAIWARLLRIAEQSLTVEVGLADRRR